MIPTTLLLGLDLEADGEHLCLGSRRAIEFTKNLGPAWGAKVVLFHSVYERRGSVEADGSVSATPAAAMALEEAAATLRGLGLTVEVVASNERPALGLIARAAAEDNCWVVLGKRSATERDRRKVGSVANVLLRSCPQPVLALSPEDAPSFRCILAATDLTETGAKISRLACEVAAKEEAKLVLLHGYQVPFELQMEAARISHEAYVERRRALLADLIDRMKSACGDKLPETTECRAVATSPSRAIKTAVAELHPDLLVLGTVSKTGLPGFFVGKTAERLLYDVDCSLLTVKPDGFGA